MTVRAWMMVTVLATLCACGGGSDRSSTPPPSTSEPTGPVSGGTNLAPVAVNDFASLSEESVSISVLVNDSDVDGDSLSIIFTGRPSHGEVVIDDNATPSFSSDDKLVYTPTLGYVGTDIFSYTITDGRDGRANGYVTVVVGSTVGGPAAAANQMPVAKSDAVATLAPEAVTVDVLSNDTDGDAQQLSLFSFSAASNGTVSLDDNGTPEGNDDRLVYVPNPGFTGTDTLTYSVTDGIDVASATVRVTVTQPDVTPVPDGQVCGIVTLGPVNNAAVSLFEIDGRGEAAGLAIAQTVTDPNGRWCVILPGDRVDLLVEARGGIFPDPSDSRYEIGGARLIRIAGQFALQTILPHDAGFTALTVFSNAVLRKSRFETEGDNFLAVFANNRQQSVDAFGFDLFTTDVSDPVLPDDSAEVDSRRYAMAVGAAATSLNQIAVDLNVAAPNYLLIDALVRDLSECRLNGRDASGPVNVSVNGQTRTISDNINLNLQILRFRNNLTEAYSGVPLLQIDQPVCEQAVVQPDLTPPRFTVLPNNVRLMAAPGASVLSTDAIIQSFLNAAIASDDRDGNVPVQFSLTDGSALPASFVFGATAVELNAVDSAGNRAEPVIRIIEVGASGPPLAFPDQATTDEDQAIAIDVVANDRGQDNALDPQSVEIVSNARFGTLSLSGGVVTYTPQFNRFGVDVFSYAVADVAGQFAAPVEVQVRVQSLNDVPVTVADSATTMSSQSVVVPVLNNDSDAEGALDVGSLQLVTPPSSGVAAVDFVTGTVVYSPTPGFAGTDFLTYRIADAEGAVSIDTLVSVRVLPAGAVASSPPVAANDLISVQEDDTVTIQILTNDSDADGDLDRSSVQLLSAPVNGTVSAPDATGAVIYIPAPNYFGSDRFTYQVADDEGQRSAPASVLINVVPGNDSPVAISDVAQGDEGNVVRIAVLDNDEDADGLAGASVALVDAPQFGSAIWDAASARLIYTPVAGFDGSDSLTYQVQDAGGLMSAPATVTINLTGQNDLPVAVADSIDVSGTGSSELDVLANDSDVDSPLINANITIVDAPVAGTVAYSAAADRLVYTPGPSNPGSDTFSYQVSDPDGALSNIAVVSVNVQQSQTAPVAVDDVVAADEQVPELVTTTANDTDADGDLDPTSVLLVTPPQFGTATVDASGQVTYVSNDNFAGQDSFEYSVADLAGARSNTATVTVTVSDVSEPPVANNDIATSAEDGSVTIDLLANDTDPESNIVVSTVSLVAQALNGTVVINATTGQALYTPDADFSGTDGFSYRVSDATGLTSNTASVAVTVTSVNDAPTATNDAVSLNEDQSVTIDLLANDTDTESNIAPDTVAVVTPAQNGSVSINLVTGQAVYTPDADYFGADSFSYTVSDTAGLVSNTASVAITITSVEDAPTAANDAVSGTEDDPVAIELLLNDSDAESNIAVTTVSVVTLPQSGAVSIDAVTGDALYTPDADFFGVDNFTYTVSDTTGLVSNVATVTVTITAVEDAPGANDDAGSSVEDGSVTIDLLANDTDPETNIDAGSVLVVGQPQNGSVSINALTGEAVYTPDADFFGTDGFSYTVSDTTGLTSNTATVAISVTSVNDNPTAADDVDSTQEDMSVTIALLDNDTDPDGQLDPGSVVIQAAPANGSVTIDALTGNALYTPDADYFGADMFTYQVADDEAGLSNIAQVSISITPVNDAPVASNDAITTLENSSVTFDAAGSGADPDGAADIVGIQVVTGPSDGAAVAGATPTELDYTPNTNFNGSDQFSYQLLDAAGELSNVATVSITISPRPSPPETVDRTATVMSDSTEDIRVLIGATDPENDIDETSVSIVTDTTQGATVVLADGTVRYTPDPGYVGLDSFTFMVSDDTALESNISTVSITVNASATGPIASDLVAPLVFSGSTPIIDLTGSVTDADGTVDFSTLTPDNASTGSVVAIGSTGSVQFSLPADFVGVATFEYSVMDNDGLDSNTAEVSITVWPAEDQDLDGVGQEFEKRIGTDPDTADSVYVHIDPDSTALAPDGSSWDLAYPTVLAALAAGRLESVPGNVVYVLMASNTDVTAVDQEWILYKDSNCDNLIFVGSLDPFVVTPRYNSDGFPSTKLEAVSNGERPVTLSGCSNVQLHYLDISGGNGVTQGGGVWLGDSEAILDSVRIFDNSAVEAGGGVYVDNSGSTPVTLTIDSSVIRDNALMPTASSNSSGGGLYIVGGALLTVSDSIIRSNRAPTNGSVAASSDSGGGGLYIEDTPLYLSGTTVSANSTAQCGGGLHVSGTDSIRIEHSSFSGNEAEQFGGGLCIRDTDANLTLHNNLITSNYSLSGGGAYLADMDQSRISSNTAVLNIADSGGGLQIDPGADPVIEYNIAQFNVANGLSADIGGDNGQLGGLDANYNFISSFFAVFVGTGNSSQQIEFDNGYYQQPSSPGVDYGVVPSNDPLFALNLRYTDKTGATTDTGLLDVGYHYLDPELGSPNQLEISAPDGLFASQNNQRFRLMPLVDGEPLGPGHRINVRSSQQSVDTHLYTYTTAILDPLGTGDSTQMRDMGDGTYEVLLDIRPSAPTFSILVYINSITTVSYSIQLN